MKHEKHDIDIKITKNSEDKINEFDAKKYLDNYIKPSEANQEKEEKYNIILKNSDWIRCGILSMSIIVGVNFASNQSWWFKPIGRQTNVLALLLVALLIIYLFEKKKSNQGKEPSLTLDNKLCLTDSLELAKIEEKISKIRAKKLFEEQLLDDKAAGTYATLALIHEFLFEEIYNFAGQIRTVNLSKGNDCFEPVMYLAAFLENIDRMPQQTFDQIVEKYVKLNIAHPFRKGNGRSMRLWLDHLLKAELGQVVDWSQVDKKDYLLAMERSPIRDTEIKHVLEQALTSDVDNRDLYMKGVDHSYYYEGYSLYKTEEL